MNYPQYFRTQVNAKEYFITAHIPQNLNGIYISPYYLRVKLREHCHVPLRLQGSNFPCPIREFCILFLEAAFHLNHQSIYITICPFVTTGNTVLIPSPVSLNIIRFNDSMLIFFYYLVSKSNQNPLLINKKNDPPFNIEKGWSNFQFRFTVTSLLPLSQFK